MEYQYLVNKLLFANKGRFYILNDKEGLPAWIISSSKLFVMRADKKSQIYLIEPKKNLTFDQLVNLHRQVEKKLDGFALMVADELNPKFRALFVKNNVSFVYKDKSIFAPCWGLKLFDYKEAQGTEKKVIEESLSPFEVKLIAGFLTGAIDREKYNLDQIIFGLSKNKYACSKSKLSNVVRHLAEKDFMSVSGKGPNRCVQFNTKEQVWEELKYREIKPFFKTIEASFKLLRKKYILSGETALANFSDLSPPEQEYVAVTSKEFFDIEKNQTKEDTNQKKVVFEVFKESPYLFAIDGYLNPIEIYLTLRNHHDERVQQSLKQMLKGFQLSV